MKEIWAWIQAALVAVGGFLGWFVGGFDGLLYALIALMAADYVTGVMCAIADRTLSSEVGFRGIAKKVLIFVLVGVGHIVDTYLIGNGSALRTAVLLFYCVNECVSILENAAKLGLPIPEKFRSVLAQIKRRTEDDSDADEPKPDKTEAAKPSDPPEKQ